MLDGQDCAGDHGADVSGQLSYQQVPAAVEAQCCGDHGQIQILKPCMPLHCALLTSQVITPGLALSQQLRSEELAVTCTVSCYMHHGTGMVSEQCANTPCSA